MDRIETVKELLFNNDERHKIIILDILYLKLKMAEKEDPLYFKTHIKLAINSIDTLKEELIILEDYYNLSLIQCIELFNIEIIDNLDIKEYIVFNTYENNIKIIDPGINYLREFYNIK